RERLGRCFGLFAERTHKSVLPVRARSPRPEETQKMAQIPQEADQLRFALWARVSTDDLHAPESSRAWQWRRAEALIGRHGRIVTEFFDIDKSRSIPPRRRPNAARLLQALEGPDRGFDAVVVGEPQRVFYDAQFNDTFPL